MHLRAVDGATRQNALGCWRATITELSGTRSMHVCIQPSRGSVVRGRQPSQTHSCRWMGKLTATRLLLLPTRNLMWSTHEDEPGNKRPTQCSSYKTHAWCGTGPTEPPSSYRRTSTLAYRISSSISFCHSLYVHALRFPGRTIADRHCPFGSLLPRDWNGCT